MKLLIFILFGYFCVFAKATISFEAPNSLPNNPQFCGTNPVCKFAENKYKCCPFENGICCGQNSGFCCPDYHICHPYIRNRCVKKNNAFKQILFPEKPDFDIKKQLLKSIQLSNVICPDGESVCQDSTTCCQLPNGDYGCCPYLNAVCCSDQEHCCPSGTTCDLQSSTCVTQKSGSALIGMKKKMPSSVICPDGASACPCGTTCCQLASGDYGCCSYPNAVCCSDKIHCCPSGTTCDLQNLVCVSENLGSTRGDVMGISGSSASLMPKSNILLPSIPKALESLGGFILCPDRRSECFTGQTCCQKSDGNYGCCPVEDAVCCNDGSHCCPQGSKCSSDGSKCIPNGQLLFLNSMNYFYQRVKNHRKSTIGALAASLNKHSTLMQCEGSDVFCGITETCCLLADSSWGCCPTPEATCCSDGYHCCPIGYSCTVDSFGCEKGTDADRVFMKSLLKHSSVSNALVTCPDGKSKCQESQSCCKSNGGYACCPLPNAVCCPVGLSCCPQGYQCSKDGSECLSNNE